jgi:hypothetical protein
MPDEPSPREYVPAKTACDRGRIGLYALMHSALTGRIRFRVVPGKPITYHLGDAVAVGAEESQTPAE